MYKLLLALCFCFGIQTALKAQEGELPPNRYVTSATTLGLGGTSLLNTYLSPLTYSGSQMSLTHDNVRRTRHFDYRLAVQNEWRGTVAYAQSPSHDSKAWLIDLSWGVKWYYSWQVRSQLTLLAGGGVEAHVGGQYNTRNGNNPAQLDLAAYLPVSAQAIYKFTLWGTPLSARYQFDMPLVGLQFSPKYNQSYYEIFQLGHSDGNLCAVSPFNAPSFRQTLALDVPIAGGTMRIGLLSDVRQSHINGIKVHAWHHSFLIGYVRHLTRIKAKDTLRHHFIY